MITVVAKLKIQKGKESDVEKALREMVEFVRAEEPGTLKYVLHQSTVDPTELLMFEQYENQAAMDIHSKSARFQSLFGVLGPLLDGQPSIELYREVAGKW